MKARIALFLCFLYAVPALLFMPMHFFSATARAESGPYEGDIREEDPRVREILIDIQAGDPPATIKLRYRGTYEDYAVFYDLDGRNVYYRYREDRFDDRAERKLRGLIEGQAYAVEGQYQGILFRGQLFTEDDEEYDELLDHNSITIVYDFTAARPLRIDQILF